MGIREVSVNPGRRTFMKGAAAGLLGAMAVSPALAEAGSSPQEASPGGQAQGAGQGGQRRAQGVRKPSLDMRDPIYIAGIADACKVVLDHFKAINQRDPKALADTLHFPFASVEQVDVVVTNTADDLMSHPPASLNMTTNPERFTDHDGYVNPGTYDVLCGLEALNSDVVQVNMAMTYDRYSPSGNKLLRCEGVYAVTNNDGRWAIQAFSTIWTPGTQVGMEFPDSVLAAHRLRETHTQGFQLMNQSDVWADTRQLGPSISINAGKDDDYGFAKPPAFKNGIKDRLHVTDWTQEKLDATKEDFPLLRERWKQMGMGAWGFDWGGGEPWRVIHAGVNKVHMYQGTTRFTAGGQYISNQAEIDVMTLKPYAGGPNGETLGGRWGWAALFGYAIRHDRTRDIANISDVQSFKV
jgi:hypothetical protein